MEQTVPNIYEYNNFRAFLRDYQQARRKWDKTFTGSGICRKLGLPRTRSYFSDVLKGKEITHTFVERFIRILGFSREQARFFRVLVNFNQARNADEREFYFDQLILLNRTPTKQVDSRIYGFYRSWYHNTIRSLLAIVDFDGDYSVLAKKIVPQISVKKIRDSVELLVQLGLISRNARGYWKPAERSIATGLCNDDLIKQYQIQCLELAKNAMVKENNRGQVFWTNTMFISKEGYTRLERRLQRFKAEIRSLVHKDENPADRVCQLNIQLFPSSK